MGFPGDPAALIVGCFAAEHIALELAVEVLEVGTLLKLWRHGEVNVAFLKLNRRNRTGACRCGRRMNRPACDIPTAALPATMDNRRWVRAP